MRTSTRHTRRGFSLLEALCAVFVLSLALSTFLSLFPYAIAQNQHDSYYLQAVAAGQEYLDALRVAAEANAPQPPYPQVQIDAGYSIADFFHNTHNASPGDFVITGQCSPWVDPMSSLRDCVVDVQWTEYGQTRSYTAESYATQQVP